MPIGMKIYLTLLVISFILFISGIIVSLIDENIGFYLMLPFGILFIGGIIYLIIETIWRC